VRRTRFSTSSKEKDTGSGSSPGGLEGATFPSRSGGVIGLQANTALPFGGLLLLHLSLWPANEVCLGWSGYVATRLRIQLSEGCGHIPGRHGVTQEAKGC